MKILVVTQYFYPETFRVNDLSTELAERGHEVDVLTAYPQYPQCRIYDGYGFNKPYQKTWNGVNINRVKVHPRGKTPFGLLYNCYGYVRQAGKWASKCKNKYDAVYVLGNSPVTSCLPALKYKEKFGTPVYFNLQDLWPDNVEHVMGVRNKLVLGFIDKIVDKIYNGSDKILCSSKSFVRNLTERGVAEEKLVFWPQFCNQPQLDGAVKPDCYDDDYFNVTFTGNVGEAQGLDLLLDAAKLLRDKPVRWFIVGDGRAKKRLENRVKEENLEGSIVFTGKVSEGEANRYVGFADCAYLSFANNPVFDMTIPAKLQTYLACGTPVLAAAGGESAEIVNVNKCGIAVNREPESVADAVLNMMAMGAEKREEIKCNCKNYFNSNFSKKIVVDKFEELIGAKTSERTVEYI